MRNTLVALSLLVAVPASATELTITLPDDANLAPERLQVTYDCAGRSMDVEYINAGAVALVSFVFEGEPVVAANVISASGARYAGRQYVWWTKGENASLYDLMQGEGAAPILECTGKM